MNDWLSTVEFLRSHAATYDEQIAEGLPTAATVRFLRDLVGSGGTALELGVGSGRVALPLAASGDVAVVGLDNSPEMLALLAVKDPDGLVQAHQADISDPAEADLGRRFDLVFCVFNTLYGITDQDAQAAVLRTAAEHLADKGHLVFETHLIGLTDFVNNKIVAPTLITPERTELVLILHDPARQTLIRQTVNFQADGVRLAPLRMRYVWPSELDLMARLAGLRLVARHGGWSGEAFTGQGVCVSVYQHDPGSREEGQGSG